MARATVAAERAARNAHRPSLRARPPRTASLPHHHRTNVHHRCTARASENTTGNVAKRPRLLSPVSFPFRPILGARGLRYTYDGRRRRCFAGSRGFTGIRPSPPTYDDQGLRARDSSRVPCQQNRFPRLRPSAALMARPRW